MLLRRVLAPMRYLAGVSVLGIVAWWYLLDALWQHCTAATGPADDRSALLAGAPGAAAAVLAATGSAYLVFGWLPRVFGVRPGRLVVATAAAVAVISLVSTTPAPGGAGCPAGAPPWWPFPVGAAPLSR